MPNIWWLLDLHFVFNWPCLCHRRRALIHLVRSFCILLFVVIAYSKCQEVTSPFQKPDLLWLFLKFLKEPIKQICFHLGLSVPKDPITLWPARSLWAPFSLSDALGRNFAIVFSCPQRKRLKVSSTRNTQKKCHL